MIWNSMVSYAPSRTWALNDKTSEVSDSSQGDEIGNLYEGNSTILTRNSSRSKSHQVILALYVISSATHIYWQVKTTKQPQVQDSISDTKVTWWNMELQITKDELQPVFAILKRQNNWEVLNEIPKSWQCFCTEPYKRLTIQLERALHHKNSWWLVTTIRTLIN